MLEYAQCNSYTGNIKASIKVNKFLMPHGIWPTHKGAFIAKFSATSAN